MIPIPEAEEYLTKRREKQEKQEKASVTFTLPALLDRGVLEQGDIVVFYENQVPEGPIVSGIRMTITGKPGSRV